MLVLTFSIAAERFALACAEVEEVVPLVPLRPVPLAPEYVLGLLRYRGALVPVIDLCRLAGAGAAAPHLSTRVIVVTSPGRPGERLGLVAEHVTDVLDTSGWREQASGLDLPEAPFLGPLLLGPNASAQRIHVADLVSDEVRRLLAGEAR